MPCDTRTLKNQTFAQRRAEVQASIAKLNSMLIAKRIKPFIGAQGAITFPGWSGVDQGRVSNACGYRLIMATGSALARAEIAKAEALSGRTVNKAVIGQGGHMHGDTFHSHKG